MTGEEWLPIAGFEGVYEVSSLGNVRSLHRLVLEAFAGPFPAGMEGCHSDGNPLNNAASNLRWDTRSANQKDAVRQKTHGNTRKTVCPEGHPYSPENTRYYRSSRYCRACGPRHKQSYKARLSERAALQAEQPTGGAS